MGDDYETEALVDQIGSPPMTPAGGRRDASAIFSASGRDGNLTNVSLDLTSGMSPAQFVEQPRPLDAVARGETPAAQAAPAPRSNGNGNGNASSDAVGVSAVVTEAMDVSQSADGHVACHVAGQITVILTATGSHTIPEHRRTFRLSLTGATAAEALARAQFHPSITVLFKAATSAVIALDAPDLEPGSSSKRIVARYMLDGDAAAPFAPLKVSTALHRVPAAASPPRGRGQGFAALLTVRFTWAPTTAGTRQGGALWVALPPPPEGAEPDENTGIRPLLLRPAAGEGVTEATDEQVTWTLCGDGEDYLPDGPSNPLAVKFVSAVPVLAEDAEPGQEPWPLTLQGRVELTERVFTDVGVAVSEEPPETDAPMPPMVAQPCRLMARTTSLVVEVPQPAPDV